MNEMKYIWKNGAFIPWKEANTHVLSHGLHYGSAVFEGIRCYKTHKGPAVFKLRQHMERFLYSAKQLGMQIDYSLDVLCHSVINTLRKNNCEEAYIRPLAYYGYGSMKVTPNADLPIDVIIACWPWGDYLDHKTVDVVTSPYIRIHPQSTIPDAKISGHYVNSILSGLTIQNTPYHETLLLDSEGFVAEGSAENIFIIKRGKVITPPKGGILLGITRNTVIEIAKKIGLSVEERYFKRDEIYSADEAFFSGTAVEVTPIRSLDERLIAQGNIGEITEKIQSYYHQIVHGQAPEFFKDLTWLNMEKEIIA